MNSQAYILGVMDGDGFIDHCNVNPRIGLEVTSEAFAKKFIGALQSIGLRPTMTKRHRNFNFKGYSYDCHIFRVTATCSELFLSTLRQTETLSAENRLSWLIGFFQAEGSQSARTYSGYPHWSWHITNKDTEKLVKVEKILASLGIKSRTIHMKDEISRTYVQRKDDIQTLNNLGVVKA